MMIGEMKISTAIWFQFLNNRQASWDKEYLGKRLLKVDPPGKKARGRPKRRRIDGVKKHMQE